MNLMKRLLTAMLLALVLTMGMPALLPEMLQTVQAAETTVKLNKKKVTLYVGETVRLKIKGTDATVTWKSTKKSVAAVSKKGNVRAKKAGTATIKATVGGQVYTCKITVKEPEIACNLPEDSAYYKYEYAYRKNDTSALTTAEKKVYKSLKACLDAAYVHTTPYEQELAVHDHILLNCAYDTTLGADGTGEAFQVEGVFGNGIAVCDGYSRAFQLCMDILGIPCIRVTGTANGGPHAWNAVQLDGEWYMVDVTWDDPVPDEAGRISYSYFNVTDEKLKRDHVYTCDIAANGTKYNYLALQDNYVTDVDSYYAYLAEAARTAVSGDTIVVTVEDGEVWTSERLEAYFDFFKVPGSTGASVSYSKYVATFTWTF